MYYQNYFIIIITQKLVWAVQFSIFGQRLFPEARLVASYTYDFPRTLLWRALTKKKKNLNKKHLLDIEMRKMNTLTKFKKPCGRPGSTSNPVGIPSAFNFLAIIMQSSKHGSISTD